MLLTETATVAGSQLLPDYLRTVAFISREPENPGVNPDWLNLGHVPPQANHCGGEGRGSLIGSARVM